MERGQHNQGQTAVEGLALAGRFGTVLGWTLLELGGIGLVAFVIAALQAQAATDAAHHAEMAWDDALNAWNDAIFSPLAHVRATAAHAAYLSANAAAQQANVRAWVIMATTGLSALVIPGVLYATHPQYLGGPLGGLLRQAATSARRRQPRPWRQITRHQGLGLMFLGVGLAIFCIVLAVAQLTVAPWWLIPAMLLHYLAYFLSIPLIGDGAWRSIPRIASQPQSEPEEP